MSATRTLSGVCAIVPTPFFEDGSIDFDSLYKLIEFYERAGCDGITILGIMGEAPKLDNSEAIELIKQIMQRTKHMWVVVGVSASGYASMRSLSDTAVNSGAAAVMIAPPNILRTDDQILDYFDQACEAIGHDVPWVLQDYPLALSVQMSVSVIQRIVSAHPSCVMLKHEDWPGLEKISALRQLERQGTIRPLSILTGNGGLFLDFEMERGADGAMTGYAFPEMLVDVVRLSASDKRDAAHDLFDSHLPLLRYEQQPNLGLAVRKYVLCRRGVLSTDAQRRPRASLSAAARGEIDYLLGRLARVDKRAGFWRR
jgi:4-hydroxy-tetrahydrodipicolinate synthase